MVNQNQSGQLAFALAGDDKASFENFWPHRNTELVAALKSVSEAQSHKVVYFYGPGGSGKSHLLFACSRVAKKRTKPISYLSLADKYVGTEMLGSLNVAGLVCLDNIHEWAGDNERERALFTLFEQIKHAEGRLVLSAIQAPEISGFKLKDLVSRLSSGLIYPLHELSDDERFSALKMRANHRGLVIPDEVLKYLVSRASRDTTALFALLNNIDQASLAEKRKITIPFLQSLFSRTKS